MKTVIFLMLGLPFLAAFTSQSANERLTYNTIAKQIKLQVETFAAASDKNSDVSTINIYSNGDIELTYAGTATVIPFNLFRLYRVQDRPLGIELVDKSIYFFIDEDKSIVISFEDTDKANEVYKAFLSLIGAGKDDYTPDFSLSINETVDSINAMLRRLTDPGYHPQISINIAGTVIITTNYKQFFSFNITELSSTDYQEGFEVNGIEMIPCTLRNVAPNSFLNFNKANGTAAYLKFYHISDKELNHLHQLFIYLRTSLVNVMYS